jgi:hypothetical protein
MANRFQRSRHRLMRAAVTDAGDGGRLRGGLGRGSRVRARPFPVSRASAMRIDGAAFHGYAFALDPSLGGGKRSKGTFAALASGTSARVKMASQC